MYGDACLGYRRAAVSSSTASLGYTTNGSKTAWPTVIPKILPLQREKIVACKTAFSPENLQAKNSF